MILLSLLQFNHLASLCMVEYQLRFTLLNADCKYTYLECYLPLVQPDLVSSSHTVLLPLNL